MTAITVLALFVHASHVIHVWIAVVFLYVFIFNARVDIKQIGAYSVLRLVRTVSMCRMIAIANQ